MEGYRKYRVLFDRLGATIVAASVDELGDMRLLAEGKRFPIREKEMGFNFCYGVTRELADSLVASWYDHEKGVVVQRKLDKPFESVMYRQGGTNEKKKKELSSRRKSGNHKAPLGRRRIRIVNM